MCDVVGTSCDGAPSSGVWSCLANCVKLRRAVLSNHMESCGTVVASLSSKFGIVGFDAGLLNVIGVVSSKFGAGVLLTNPGDGGVSFASHWASSNQLAFGGVLPAEAFALVFAASPRAWSVLSKPLVWMGSFCLSSSCSRPSPAVWPRPDPRWAYIMLRLMPWKLIACPCDALRGMAYTDAPACVVATFILDVSPCLFPRMLASIEYNWSCWLF